MLFPQLLGVYAGSVLQWSMQTRVLGSVPPVGVSWRAGAVTLSWYCTLRSPCNSEGWTTAQTQTFLREASGKCTAVRRHLWWQRRQLQSCISSDASSWRYAAWRLVSVCHGTAATNYMQLSWFSTLLEINIELVYFKRSCNFLQGPNWRQSFQTKNVLVCFRNSSNKTEIRFSFYVFLIKFLELQYITELYHSFLFN